MSLAEIEAELGKLSPDELRRLPHPPWLANCGGAALLGWSPWIRPRFI